MELERQRCYPHGRSGMHREQGKNEILVAQEPVRLRLYGGRYLRSKSEQGLESSNAIHSHAQVNHDQVGILREINGLTFDPRRHIYTSLFTTIPVLLSSSED